jgi:hypothetical protein
LYLFLEVTFDLFVSALTFSFPRQERQAAKRVRTKDATSAAKRTSSNRSQVANMEVDVSPTPQPDSDRTRRYNMRQLYRKN